MQVVMKPMKQAKAWNTHCGQAPLRGLAWWGSSDLEGFVFQTPTFNSVTLRRNNCRESLSWALRACANLPRQCLNTSFATMHLSEHGTWHWLSTKYKATLPTCLLFPWVLHFSLTQFLRSLWYHLIRPHVHGWGKVLWNRESQDGVAMTSEVQSVETPRTTLLALCLRQWWRPGNYM